MSARQEIDQRICPDGFRTWRRQRRRTTGRMELFICVNAEIGMFVCVITQAGKPKPIPITLVLLGVGGAAIILVSEASQRHQR